MSVTDWNWNPVDLAVMALLLAGIVGGFLRGFTWQVVRLAFLVVAFLVAGRYSEPVGRWIGDLTGQRVSDGIERGLAYVLLFGATYLGSVPIALLLRSGIAKLKLASYDRAVGGLLGLFKSSVVAYVALLLLMYFAPRLLSDENRVEPAVRASFAYEAVSIANPTLAGILPAEFHDTVSELRARVEERLGTDEEVIDGGASTAPDDATGLEPGDVGTVGREAPQDPSGSVGGTSVDGGMPMGDGAESPEARRKAVEPAVLDAARDPDGR